MPAVAAALLFLVLLPGCGERPPDFDPWLFLDGDLSRLAEHSESRQFLFSSRDRTGGNDDGFSGLFSALRRDVNGEFVLAEMEGPGCVRRIWLTWPGLDTTIRVYLDGSADPVIDAPLEEFFSGRRIPFVAPWIGASNRFGGICFTYIPIPFRESVKITTTDGIRFYQINVERLPRGTDVESFDRAVSSGESERLTAAKRAISELPGSASMDAAWTVAGSDAMESIRDRYEIAPGGEVTIFESDRPGAVEELRLRVPPPAEELRRVVLSAYWDGEEEPSVRVPLSDLFGSAFAPPATWSLPIQSIDGCGIVRFPMPFESARVTLGARGGAATVDAALLVSRKEPADGMRFHALWRQQASREGEPVTLLDTQGRGVYVGTILSAVAGRTDQFLEGDEAIVVDGSTETALRGTGTEDYFNSGWYFARAGMLQPFHGAAFVDRENALRFSAFRFHLTDRIPFARSLSFSFEHGDRNRETGSIYASVALWYQEGGGAKTGAIPDTLAFLPKRMVHPLHMQPLRLADGARGGTAGRVVTWPEVSDQWIGPPGAAESTPLTALLGAGPVEFAFTVPAAGRYDVSLVFARGAGFASFDLLLDGATLVRSVAATAGGIEPCRQTEAIRRRLAEGEHRLTVRPEGKVADGAGLTGLVQGVLLEPAGPFLTNWLVAGPFDNMVDRGFDQVYPPEEEHRSGGIAGGDGTYEGMGGAAVRWTGATADSTGYVDLRAAIGAGTHRVGYGVTWCDSPDARRVLFSCGGDDGLAVWVNGREVWRNHIHRGWWEGEDRFPVDLDAGRNEILVKVDQYIAGWGFSVRVTDPDGRLAFRE